MPGPQDPAAAAATSKRSAVSHNGRTDHSRSWEELAFADDEEAWRAQDPSGADAHGGTVDHGVVLFRAGDVDGWGLAGRLIRGSDYAGHPLAVRPVRRRAVPGRRRHRLPQGPGRDRRRLPHHLGRFWVSWGVLEAPASSGVIAPVHLGAASPSFAFWFIGLTIVTASAMLASLARNLVQSVTLGILAAASALTAAGFCGGSLGTLHVGGWCFVASATAAWILGTAMMLEHAFGRTVLPLGAYRKEANVPGRRATIPIEWESGMPGVRADQ